MRIVEQPRSDEPIIFDLNQVPEGWQRTRPLSMVFEMGQAQFEDPAHTVVAICGGISDDGELNLPMLGAHEQIADYLDGKHGQAVLVSETITLDTQTLTKAYIGRLALDGPLFGLVPDKRSRAATPKLQHGIATQGPSQKFSFRISSDNELGGLDYHEETRTSIPLYPDPTVGDVSKANARSPQTVWQDINVGDSIVPWLTENAPDDKGIYAIYRFLLNSLSLTMRPVSGDQSFLDSLLVEPYIGSYVREHEAYTSAIKELETYQQIQAEYRAGLAENLKRASTALALIEQRHPDLLRFFPQAATSYPTRVTSTLADPAGDQIKSRILATRRRINRSGPIVMRAMHKQANS